ncbi:MAG: hypothetical protein HUU14_08685 [Dehalococcoidia bacterium]|nr:MAG: hypothetical protein EDM76_12830 [bacterium]MCE7929209.1 hypothetical protein [Chloroflexi bacterium CFX7]MCK6565602.1 hypothetical protein [Dehalococcoidia bacterium]MCL4231805.1 hypothetical protein [Dehalococcoidia bacterium]NUQ55944.1 hypothetical protein [Dehalococcoidia bacterium]
MVLLSGERFTAVSYGPAAAYAGWLRRRFGAGVETVAQRPAQAVALAADGVISPPVAAARVS